MKKDEQFTKCEKEQEASHILKRPQSCKKINLQLGSYSAWFDLDVQHIMDIPCLRRASVLRKRKGSEPRNNHLADVAFAPCFLKP